MSTPMDVKDEVAALNLGSQIRQLRKQRGLTLQDVSNMTGLSKPLLSQIENNIAAPPIATLIKISSALGVKIGHFFQDTSLTKRIVVVRKADRYGVKKRVHHTNSDNIGYHYEPLAYPMVDKQMEPFLVEFEQREEKDLLFNNHRGEEFLFVIEGELEFRCSDQIITLVEGDSLYFDSGIPHAMRGIDKTAKALIIVYTSI